MAVFTARTRLRPDPAITDEAGAAAADEHVESLRQQWNQHGIEVLIGAADDPGGGVIVRYRLSVGAGHAEPGRVHQAFRDDLDRALAMLTDRGQPPEAWDFASLAAAAAAAECASQPPATRDYEADTSDWLS